MWLIRLRVYVSAGLVFIGYRGVEWSLQGRTRVFAPKVFQSMLRPAASTPADRATSQPAGQIAIIDSDHKQASGIASKHKQAQASPKQASKPAKFQQQ
jgi:hypothetical protein|eukprot:COSAG06_NODE_120_length_23106_cov_18.311862_27_plen_98_part_00